LKDLWDTGGLQKSLAFYPFPNEETEARERWDLTQGPVGFELHLEIGSSETGQSVYVCIG
jgi:hypothetical protein